jgi:hypothetical protein
MVFKNIIMMNMFWPKKGQLTMEWTDPYNTELQKFYSYPLLYLLLV